MNIFSELNPGHHNKKSAEILWNLNEMKAPKSFLHFKSKIYHLTFLKKKIAKYL